MAGQRDRDVVRFFIAQAGERLDTPEQHAFGRGRAVISEQVRKHSAVDAQNCASCHFVQTAKSVIAGDISSHTFDIIWPRGMSRGRRRRP